jgi:RNA:NAD 2'-phosphotransferase (TPT1/KptA family)
MSSQRSPKQLAKFLNYVLGRRPDEFGLVTDKEGFVKIKDLIKATGEEEGLKYVRRAHINEVMLTLPNHGLEIADKLIRAQNREHLPKQSFALDPPKLLYTCVRKKAYPHVLDKGIRPTGFSKVILSSNRDLAERMGRRSDHDAAFQPVALAARRCPRNCRTLARRTGQNRNRLKRRPEAFSWILIKKKTREHPDQNKNAATKQTNQGESVRPGESKVHGPGSQGS